MADSAGGEPTLSEAQAYANGRSGKLEKAPEALKKLTDASKNEELDPIVFVFADLGVGIKEERNRVAAKRIRAALQLPLMASCRDATRVEFLVGL
jgi:hypothetical protein